MKKIVLYLFATIGLISLLFALYSLLFSISGSTMYGSSESVGAIPGSINQSAQYSTLQQAPSSTGTPVAFAELNNNPSAPALATQETMKRMIIRNANLTLEVVDISQAMNKISNLANTSGGYVVSSNSNQNDQVGIYNSAQISIRIPAEGFKKAIDQLKTFAIKVNNENSTGEDITQRYVDLQSTLNNLETAKKQLQKIMDGAKKTGDVLNVFKQLTTTQGQIDLVQGQIKYYSQSVALSLINITLEPKSASPIAKIRSWELMKVTKEAYQSLLNQLEALTYNVIRFIIFFLPLVLIWSTIIFLIFILGRKLYFWYRKPN